MTKSSSFPDLSLRGFTVGEWQADRADGTLTGSGTQQRLEPKVMDLLILLAGQEGRVVSRDDIMTALWPGLVVGEDSLARTVSKLRQALGDDAKAPTYIETIAKRGYRLLADVGPLPAQAPSGRQEESAAKFSSRLAVWIAVGLAVVAALGIAAYVLLGHSAHPPQDESRQLLTRADDYYFQFSRGDNEAAIELYQRVLGLHPDDALAMARLAGHGSHGEDLQPREPLLAGPTGQRDPRDRRLSSRGRAPAPPHAAQGRRGARDARALALA